jgi:ADP-heptose:LPS heptosyltransferase
LVIFFPEARDGIFYLSKADDTSFLDVGKITCISSMFVNFFARSMLADPSLTISSIGVIVGLDLVGDALIKLPFVRALRTAFPDATLHWITSQGPTAYNGPLRELTRHLIDNVFEQPSWLPTKQNPQISDIDPPHFDLLIDTRGKWREAWRARTSVPSKIFISPAVRFVLSDRGKAFFQKRPPHLVDKLVQLVELAGGTFSVTEERLPVPELLLLKARQMMPRGETYIGLAPGAGNPVKIWPRADRKSVV